MDFSRHGMKGAQPRFALCPDGLPRGKRGGILYSASELIEADPDKVLRHPDADWIAAANPSAVLELIAEVERLRAMQGSAEPVCYVAESSLKCLARNEVAENGAMLKKSAGRKDVALYTAPPAPVSAEPVEPFAFVIVDKNGNPEFVTSTHDEAQAHINDAISEHNIHGAGKWRSIPAYEMRPSDDKLWEQTLHERDYNAEIADKLADAISRYFNEEIGEHSNMNCPWLEALRVIEEAPPSTDAKDAARYRWLRQCGEEFASMRIMDSRGDIDPKALDEVCDAAIAAKEAGKHD